MRRLIPCLMMSTLLLMGTVFILEAGCEPRTSPVIAAITPHTGPADQQTEVVITGQGFVSTTTASLGETPLLEVTFVDSTTLEASVPFNLPTDVYTLTVTHPQSATLSRAFTVTKGTIGWSSAGPYGGRTHGIAVHPELTDTVYVVTALTGLFRTVDGGERWGLVKHSPVQPNDVVAVWPVDPAVVFFGGLDGLYRSEQGGDVGSWQQLAFPTALPLNQPSALSIAASAPYTMYCAIANTVFYSRDGGVTWEERSAGLPDKAPNLLAVDQDNAARVYAAYGQEGALYRTENAGREWVKLPFTLPMTGEGKGGLSALATAPYPDNTLWLGSFNQGLYRSIDGGETFSEVTSLQTVTHQSWVSTISFDPNRERIYVGTIGPNDALYYSDDNGGTWHGLGLNNEGGANIAVTPGDSETIYTTWAGVRKSTNGGQTWTWLSEGIAGIQPQRIAVSPHDPQRVIVTAYADGVFGTHNGGNTWVRYDVSPHAESYQAVSFDPVSPTVAYVGGTGTVFKTVDDGQSWVATDPLPLDGLPSSYDAAQPLALAVDPQTHIRVYAGVSFFSIGTELINAGGLYHSDSGGDHWTRFTAIGPISPVHRIAFAPSDPDIIYLGTGGACHWCDGDGIWRSLDGGQTWQHPETTLDGQRVLALAVHPNNPPKLLAGVWSGTNDGEGIFYSEDSGDSWQPASGLESREERKVPDLLYHPLCPSIVYAATHAGLRISFDAGESWEPYSGAFGQVPVTSLAITADDEGNVWLYVGTVGGTVVTTSNPGLGTQAVLGAGVYVRRSRWTPVYLPLVLRSSQ